MNFTVTMHGDVSVVVIAVDHLDARNVGEFKTEMLQMVQDHKKVVFDCEQISMIDSSGLGAIINVAQALRTAGSELKLAALSKGVSSLFKLVRMQRIVAIHGTVEEAVQTY